MPRKKTAVETGLENTTKALRSTAKVIKAFKRKPVPKNQQGTAFPFGENVEHPPIKPLRIKSVPMTSLPIKRRKSIGALVNQIEKNSAKLDATLKPGQLISIEIRGSHKGKKFINKSYKTFSSYSALARFLRSYERNTKGNTVKSLKDQNQLIENLHVVSFPEQNQKEYEFKALRSQTEHARARKKRIEKAKTEQKKTKAKLKETEAKMTRSKNVQALQKQQIKEAAKREKSLLSTMKKMAEQMKAMQKEIAKLQKSQTKKTKPSKKGAKSNVTKPMGKKRASNRAGKSKRK